MFDWIKILGLTFIAPKRGLVAAYSRGLLGPAIVLLFLTQVSFVLYTLWPYLLLRHGGRSFSAILEAVLTVFTSVIVINLIFVPVTILISNLFERRGSVGQVIRQEFITTASTICYAYSAVYCWGLLIALVAKRSQWLATLANQNISAVRETWKNYPDVLREAERQQMLSVEYMMGAIIQLFIYPILAVLILFAVRAAFRLLWFRTIIIALAAFLIQALVSPIFQSGVGFVLASPLLLIVGFFILQGYWREVAKRRQAQLDFERSLETATLNPADASSHYNLGLIYQQRGDLDSARKSFERAVEIDFDEIDAHYQLGRIARAQNRLQESITHFGEVVLRDESHAQNEIWREIGMTYFAAEQYADAKEALEKFLAERVNDPEGLYLMGRTQASLGNKRAAASALQACIQAVKTAPAYKYRLEKHWLNEAEKLLKSLQPNI